VIEMVVLETKQMKEVVTRHRHCDVCGEPMTMQCTSHNCSMCGCDICSACSHEDEEGYRHYCPTCWSIGEPYRKILDITSQEYYARIDAIMAQWREEINRRKGSCKK